jgi:hypothetical protein
MYTSRSESFSPEFKAKAMVAIQKQIEFYKTLSPSVFDALAKVDNAEQVMAYGRRWRDPEQVYQAMIMRLEQRIIKERGPGMMTDGEAKELENMFMLPTTGYMFDIAAGNGVAGAASCDHWYMFEKEWD